MPPIKRAAQYRQLAEECRSVARTLSTPEARNHMLAMADQWDRLAQVQETATDLKGSRGEQP